MNRTGYFSRRRSVRGIAKRQGRLCGSVLDGLLHNEVVESDIHSTDTHGYTEVIFALTYLLGIQFAASGNFRIGSFILCPTWMGSI